MADAALLPPHESKKSAEDENFPILKMLNRQWKDGMQVTIRSKAMGRKRERE
jgi:hypothetical protein